MSIADYNQDAILLINLNGRLFINCNDATIRNCRSFIRKISKKFEKSYLLSLSGYGDADIINIFDEKGKRIPPAASFKNSVGKSLSEKAKVLGANHVIPFLRIYCIFKKFLFFVIFLQTEIDPKKKIIYAIM